MMKAFTVESGMLQALADQYFEKRMPLALEGYLQVRYSDAASAAFRPEDREHLMYEMGSDCRAYLDGSLDQGLLESCAEMKSEIESLSDRIDYVRQQDQKTERRRDKALAFIREKDLQKDFVTFYMKHPALPPAPEAEEGAADDLE